MHDSKIHHDHDMKNIIEFDGFLKESETLASNDAIDFAISELRKIYKICVATLTYSSNMKEKGAGKIIEERIKELEKMKRPK